MSKKKAMPDNKNKQYNLIKITIIIITVIKLTKSFNLKWIDGRKRQLTQHIYTLSSGLYINFYIFAWMSLTPLPVKLVWFQLCLSNQQHKLSSLLNSKLPSTCKPYNLCQNTHRLIKHICFNNKPLSHVFKRSTNFWFGI